MTATRPKGSHGITLFDARLVLFAGKVKRFGEFVLFIAAVYLFCLRSLLRASGLPTSLVTSFLRKTILNTLILCYNLYNVAFVNVED